MSRARHPFNDRGAEVDTKNQRATDPSFNRRDLIGGLLAATALASVPAEAQTQHGGGHFLRKRPSLPAPQAGNALVNPPAIVPGTQGGTNYALNMVQQNFTVAGNTASLYSYADPNNSTPNPNIVGPTITIPNNAKNGFAFSLNLTNNLPLNTGASHAGHAPAAALGSGETAHGFDVTNIHTHGLHVAPAQDNVYVVLCPTGATSCSADSAPKSSNPQITAATGTIQYAYNVGPSGPSTAPAHPAGTYWYHPHKHGSTAIQVANGMTGALIVQGDLDAIPGVAGLTEQVMVIQQIEYNMPPATTGCTVGVVDPNVLYSGGNCATNAQITINGQTNPQVTMQAGEIQRWRVINTTYSAFLSLSFGGATAGSGTAPTMYAIATDGVPLTHVPGVITVPYQLGAPPAAPTTVAQAIMNEIAILAPGQRLDLLVQAPTVANGGQNGAAFPLTANFFETQGANPQTIATVLYSGAKATADALPASSAFALNALIRPQFDYAGLVPPPPLAGGNQSSWGINFNFNLSGGASTPGCPVAPANGNGNSAVCVQRGADTPVNGQFDPNNAQVLLDLYDKTKKNTTYWQVSATGALHAFHIHINSFLLTFRSYVNGTAPIPLLEANIWRDTLRIDPLPTSGSLPGPTVTMASQQYDYSGWYVMHCHVLDHEDTGMMVSVKIGS